MQEERGQGQLSDPGRMAVMLTRSWRRLDIILDSSLGQDSGLLAPALQVLRPLPLEGWWASLVETNAMRLQQCWSAWWREQAPAA